MSINAGTYHDEDSNEKLISRRGFLAGSAAFGAGMLLPGGPLRANGVSRTEPSLSEIGNANGIQVGTALNVNNLGIDELTTLVNHHANLVVHENSLKPKRVSLSPGIGSFSGSDKLYDFAQEHGKDVHGHTLYWHQSPIYYISPERGATTLEDAKRLYGDFVQMVLDRYPQTQSWDVFNEIFEESTRLRPAYLIKEFGIPFIAYILQVAREAAPDAKLLINDYNLSCQGNWCRDKQRNALDVIDELIAQGVPLDAVGIQSHLQSKYPPSPSRTGRFIDQLADRGLDAHLTELDVNDSEFPQSISRRDRAVASYYRDYLSEVLKRPSVKRVTFWGLTDQHSWITRGHAGDRITGVEPRPALFDDSYNPKSSFDAVIDTLGNAPDRDNDLLST